MNDLDPTILEAQVNRIQASLVGAATAQMAYLGDRLGLYRALADIGPATPAELAERSGCAERYVREWLLQQTTVGFITHEPESGRYAIPAEHALLLGPEDAPMAFAGAFEANAGFGVDVDRVAEAFRSGDGIPYGAHDARVHRGVARFFGGAYRAALIDAWIPALGVGPKLQAGAIVADVGCGEGVSTVLLATAFPESRFVGVDTHGPSLEAARKRAANAGVSDRVRFEMADATAFDGGPFDLIWLFDVLHDLGDPAALIARCAAQLADDGTVAIVEPFAHEDPDRNVAENPGAGLHYMASTFLCIPHSLSEPGHAALGAQAGPRVLENVVREGGLRQFERVAVTPIHAVYAARP